MIFWITHWEKPLGLVWAAASEKGLSALAFSEHEPDVERLKKRFSGSISFSENKHLMQARQEVTVHFSGTRQGFSIALDILGTMFQQSVWKELQHIPFGRTRTYKEQAIQFGSQKAIRAVAAANGQNPVAILIPCHWVVGSDGSLTGYAGGLTRKRWLLDHEQKVVGRAQMSLFSSS